MKKIVLLVALCLCVGNLFAQDADKLRDEGDAALKAKDYATVVTKYGEYLKQNNYQDTARIFNCGYAANQAKNYAEAAKYFDMAVKMNYNVDDSYVGEAMAYRNLNKTEEFLTTVKEGLKVIPDGNKNKTNLEKLLYGYCIKQGQAAQKKGDLAGAEKMYKEVLAVSNKDYQSNAYYSLGAMLYGNGAKILQAATPIATSEPDKYNAEKAKADKDVNTIKLDKLFLTRCSSNARGTDFLREVVHLVKRLGYNVICEGIETEEQVQLLRSLDCDGAQGFWFSKAISAEEFEWRYLCD